MRYIPLGFYTLPLFGFLLSCSEPATEITIAFGSCSHQFDSVQMWETVAKNHPDAWIWLGDNIYGDTEDMDIMREKYQLQKRRDTYQALMRSTKIYGIWDDHDYGVNDGGKEYRMKDESKMLMLDFLDIPKDAEVRGHPGTYQSHLIEKGSLTIKLILLDTRYFRDTLERNIYAPPLYLPNTGGTILGEDQWRWLERQLTGSAADLHLIASSIQVIPEDHGYEKWGNFPKERDRLMNLIAKTRPTRPIILSGDRHIAEFSKIEPKGMQYPIFEFTSSGLTHTWGTSRPEKNRHRIGKMIIKKNFGIIKIKKETNSLYIDLQVRGDQNQVFAATPAIF